MESMICYQQIYKSLTPFKSKKICLRLYWKTKPPKKGIKEIWHAALRFPFMTNHFSIVMHSCKDLKTFRTLIFLACLFYGMSEWHTHLVYSTDETKKWRDMNCHRIIKMLTTTNKHISTITTRINHYIVENLSPSSAVSTASTCNLLIYHFIWKFFLWLFLLLIVITFHSKHVFFRYGNQYIGCEHFCSCIAVDLLLAIFSEIKAE